MSVFRVPEKGVTLKSKLSILGIETSCDETSAAVVSGSLEVLSNVIASQIPTHQLYGGVVPEIASRQHLEQVNFVVKQALDDAHHSLSDISGIAVTCGPGLVGALLVGVSLAKGLAYGSGIPIVGVNHIEGHLYANLLSQDYKKSEEIWPSLALIVSGGHTELILWHKNDKLERLGSTKDDAAGEALDKFARVLGLSYPGGPAIEQAATNGNDHSMILPTIAFEGKLDFSFSGLKTAALNAVHKAKQQGKPLTVEDAAASYQRAVVDTLLVKTKQALIETGAKRLFLAGGVAANSLLRKQMQLLCQNEGVILNVPERWLCTDNAAMIAAAGLTKLQLGYQATLSLNAYPSLKLGQDIPDEVFLHSDIS